VLIVGLSPFFQREGSAEDALYLTPAVDGARALYRHDGADPGQAIEALRRGP
jgi:hypothetical protein